MGRSARAAGSRCAPKKCTIKSVAKRTEMSFQYIAKIKFNRGILARCSSATEIMELPTPNDISPRFGRGDEALEEAYARKTFSGKDLSEAELLFRQNALFHAESLLWMGKRGFQFYIEAFIA